MGGEGRAGTFPFSSRAAETTELALSELRVLCGSARETKGSAREKEVPEQEQVTANGTN